MYQGKARNQKSWITNLIGFFLELICIIGLALLIALAVVGTL